MQRLVRSLFSLAGATGVTLGLFLLMYQLVQFDPVEPGTQSGTVDFQFRQVIPETTPPPPPDEPTKPDKPKPLPPVKDLNIVSPTEPVRSVPDMTMTQGPGVPVSLDNPGTAAGRGGSLLATVRVQPPYPRRAALAGTTGWVKVSFTVTPQGTVVDPRVVASEPPRVFDNAALGAIVKWRFRPRTVNGEPVRVRATQTFQFSLDD